MHISVVNHAKDSLVITHDKRDSAEHGGKKAREEEFLRRGAEMVQGPRKI